MFSTEQVRLFVRSTVDEADLRTTRRTQFRRQCAALYGWVGPRGLSTKGDGAHHLRMLSYWQSVSVSLVLLRHGGRHGVGHSHERVASVCRNLSQNNYNTIQFPRRITQMPLAAVMILIREYES